jgi:hypothetical protein
MFCGFFPKVLLPDFPDMRPIEGGDIEVNLPVRQANIVSFILFFAAILVFGLPFIFFWSLPEFLVAWISFLTDLKTLLPSILGGMAVHEVLHAIAWAAFCRNGFRSIEFGIHWKSLAPYVHCSEFLRLRHYRIGVLLPGVLLGLLPALAGTVTGITWLFCFGIFFTAGAAGDFLSLYALRRFQAQDLVMDHPRHLGFIVRKANELMGIIVIVMCV